MPETITLRWGGPASAASGSRYRIEATLDWATWTELAAAQAATSPYASVTAVLASDVDYGATTVAMVSAGSLAAAGYLWLDEALVEWASKSGDNLQGCTWHSGAGTYAAGTVATQAHESYVHSGVTPTNGAVVYRITHIDATDRESAPTEIWYWYPARPATSRHCRVIVALGYDVGHGVQANVQVKARLRTDDQFLKTGLHLDMDHSPANTVTTNALGLAEFDCVKNSGRWAKGKGAASGYEFILNLASGPQTISVPTIPDRDWVVVGADVGE